MRVGAAVSGRARALRVILIKPTFSALFQGNMPNFHLLPTRFNSLRLLDLDPPDVIKSYFVTMETYKFAPFFGDIRLAKQVVAALFEESDRCEIELYSYVVMTDHIHFLAGAGSRISNGSWVCSRVIRHDCYGNAVGRSPEGTASHALSSLGHVSET